MWGALASHPLDVILQYNLAKDAVQALYEVHGIKYIYGSVSTTLCECVPSPGCCFRHHVHLGWGMCRLFVDWQA